MVSRQWWWQRHWPLVGGLALLLASLMIFDRPLIRGDAVAYYMWTASSGKDFDKDMAKQEQRLGTRNT